MLITESQMYSSSYNINNVYSLLESMYYIPNQDDNPQLIPVIENTQVGKVLIPLEELYEYKVNKGYSNLVYALEDVCYTNNIDSSYVGFTINDYSLLENTYYPVLVNTLLENGICVLCKNRIDYALNEALDQCLYEAVVNNDHTLIRANQGHSIPVDVELEEKIPPEIVFKYSRQNTDPNRGRELER